MSIKPGLMGRPAGPTHRTHQERNAETQQKLIKAAIHCLRTYGYAATSTTLVAEIAGLSRGTILHHFGTKVELMLAVARYVVADQNRFMQERVQKYPPGRERYIGLTEATWDSIRQPESIALLEIMMASRSDDELAKQFPEVAEQLAHSQLSGAWSLAKLAGITDRAAVETLSQLHRAAMQGLSMMMIFSKDPRAMEPMLALLSEYKAYYTDKLLALADPKHLKVEAAARKKSKRSAASSPDPKTR